jgi:hypothetical protein
MRIRTWEHWAVAATAALILIVTWISVILDSNAASPNTDEKYRLEIQHYSVTTKQPVDQPQPLSSKLLEIGDCINALMTISRAGEERDYTRPEGTYSVFRCVNVNAETTVESK